MVAEELASLWLDEGIVVPRYVCQPQERRKHLLVQSSCLVECPHHCHMQAHVDVVGETVGYG